MSKYRNISGETLWVDLGNGQFPKVEDGDIVDIPDDPTRYIQTGETGETPLWEAVAAPSTKKSAPAEKE